MIISKEPTNIRACLLPVPVPADLDHIPFHNITRFPLFAAVALHVGKEKYFLSMDVDQKNALGDLLQEQEVGFNNWVWIDWEKI